ncbi:MAG: restriction endonuclease, partial [Patescibacteria group bacterium]
RVKRETAEKAVQDAADMTTKAKKEIDSYSNILSATLSVDDTIKWDNIRNVELFREYKPFPKPIEKNYFLGVPKKSIIEIIPYFKTRRLRMEGLSGEKFKNATRDWEKSEEALYAKYKHEKADFISQQQTYNANLDSIRQQFEAGESGGVIKYFDLVLDKSRYPDSLNLNFDVHLVAKSKLLVVDIELPNTEQIPAIVEYRYVRSTGEIKGKMMNIRDFERYYDDVIYQIALRTIHEIFEADYKQNIELVVLNGWVRGIDGKTGKEFQNCIISLQIGREEFLSLDLSRINSAECFRHLKGVSAGALAKLAPVKPIMRMDTNDSRIVSADAVVDTLDSSDNLAMMDWKDFEVLVRDLIQKEFSHEGCRVEVTRASRDAGVDAIAYDEDPIRGGKYVIQAKRYNNLVPLTAVRDLFGTVHNEGAVKGILVTTSYYGKDALEFVKDKPLTLINGEELLYMFNKHGYKFKIELTKKQKRASSNPY